VLPKITRELIQICGTNKTVTVYFPSGTATGLVVEIDVKEDHIYMIDNDPCTKEWFLNLSAIHGLHFEHLQKNTFVGYFAG